MKILVVIVTGIFCYANGVFADEEAIQISRFLPSLQKLDEACKSSTEVSEVAEALVKDDFRELAFYLQALGKVYQDLDTVFTSFRFDFKDLEDAIGEYKKYSDWLEAAEEMRGDEQAEGEVSEKTEEKIEDLQSKKKSALAELSRFLNKSGQIKDQGKTKKTPPWTNPAKENRTTFWLRYITNYDWLSYKKDQKYYLKQLRSQLEKIYSAEWDLGFLEKGYGVHELRREVRWFNMQAKSLNGAITFREDDEDCPIAEYRSLLASEIATSKYALLADNPDEKKPCRISKCLFLATTDVIAKVGKIKDEVEIENNVHQDHADVTPEKYRKKAQAVLDEMLGNELLQTIDGQLQSCKD